jgi:hypothetical protein
MVEAAAHVGGGVSAGILLLGSHDKEAQAPTPGIGLLLLAHSRRRGMHFQEIS